MFQAEGTASAGAVKQEYAWCSQGTRRPMSFKSRINFHARLTNNLSMNGLDLNQCCWSLVLCRSNHEFIINQFALVLDYSIIALAGTVSFYFYHSASFTAT